MWYKFQWRRGIRATRCFTPFGLYTQVDGQCDKLATVVGRLWQYLWQSTVRGKIFVSPGFGEKDTEFPYNTIYRIRRLEPLCKNMSWILSAVSIQYRFVHERRMQRHKPTADTALACRRANRMFPRLFSSSRGKQGDIHKRCIQNSGIFLSSSPMSAYVHFCQTSPSYGGPLNMAQLSSRVYICPLLT